jgi:hypothetical protein
MADAIVAPSRTKWLLAATPILLLLTHYVAVLPHEFAHSIVAWLVGIKSVPGDIYWGPGSVVNIALLVDINEHVDYSAALDAGRKWQVALAALAGPIIANGGLYVVSRLLLRTSYFAARPSYTYVLFWFYLMNAANLYCYIPLRVFPEDGDVYHFLLGSGMSPLWVYVVGGYLILWMFFDMYRVVLPDVLRICGFISHIERAAVLVVATVVTFGYFAIPGLLEDNNNSILLGRTSIMAIPVILLLTWRRIVLADLSDAASRVRHVGV